MNQFKYDLIQLDFRTTNDQQQDDPNHFLNFCRISKGYLKQEISPCDSNQFYEIEFQSIKDEDENENGEEHELGFAERYDLAEQNDTNFYNINNYLQNQQVKKPVQKQRKGLFEMNSKRPALVIQFQKKIEKKYCNIEKGNSDETRHLHKHIKKSLKDTFKQFKKKGLISNNSEQDKLIQNYCKENPSFQSLQLLLGVTTDSEQNIIVSKDAQNIRLLLNQEIINGNKLTRAISSSRSFAQKLIEIKYMQIFRQGVLFPEKFTKWKN